MKTLTLQIGDDLHARLVRLTTLRRRRALGCGGDTPEITAAHLLEDALFERLQMAERFDRMSRAARSES